MDNNMEIEKYKEKLEKEKESLEKELQKFASKDKKLEGDWDTKYPEIGEGEDEAADEVEEYANMLPIEYKLETKLRDVKNALDKIEKGDYGKCEKCRKEISEARLEIYPEARTCGKCE